MERHFHLAFGSKNTRVRLVQSRQRTNTAERISPRSMPVETVKVAHGLNTGNPQLLNQPGCADINLASAGLILDNTTTAFFHPDTRVLVGNFVRYVRLHNPDGSLKEEKPAVTRKCNTNDAAPVSILKMVDKAKLFSGFVITKVYQLAHEDGIQYDFLFNLAKELQSTDKAALLGVGPKGGPLVFTNGGKPYRCALIGRVDGTKYLLQLLVLGQELKLPTV